MSESNKAIAKRFLEEVWSNGNLAVVDELMTENFVGHNMQPQLPNNREGFKMFARAYLAAFPDMDMSADDIIAEGDKVVVRWSAEGKHKGDLMGIPATNKEVKVSGISIDRYESGKIVESWGEFDLAGMLVQLGVVPPLGG